MPQMNIVANPKSTVIRQESIGEGIKDYLNSLSELSKLKTYEQNRALATRTDEEIRRHNLIMEDVAQQGVKSESAKNILNLETGVRAQNRMEAKDKVDKLLADINWMSRPYEERQKEVNQVYEDAEKASNLQINHLRQTHKIITGIDLPESPLYSSEKIVLPKETPKKTTDIVGDYTLFVQQNPNSPKASDKTIKTFIQIAVKDDLISRPDAAEGEQKIKEARDNALKGGIKVGPRIMQSLAGVGQTAMGGASMVGAPMAVLMDYLGIPGGMPFTEAIGTAQSITDEGLSKLFPGRPIREQQSKLRPEVILQLLQNMPKVRN